MRNRAGFLHLRPEALNDAHACQALYCKIDTRSGLDVTVSVFQSGTHLPGIVSTGLDMIAYTAFFFVEIKCSADVKL